MNRIMESDSTLKIDTEVYRYPKVKRAKPASAPVIYRWAA